MPLLKHAIKKMKQDVQKTRRNNVYRNRLTTRMKDIEKAIHDKKHDELPALLKNAYSIIDTACKKNLIKKNNASRKKSRMARIVNEALMGMKG
ncbi:MAG: 30S ribosomal protein S20 [bacterium]|nr:30S ribosomal protein S20 [bacterium]